MDVTQLSGKFDELLADGDTSAGLGMASAMASNLNSGTGNGTESTDQKQEEKVICLTVISYFTNCRKFNDIS